MLGLRDALQFLMPGAGSAGGSDSLLLKSLAGPGASWGAADFFSFLLGSVAGAGQHGTGKAGSAIDVASDASRHGVGAIGDSDHATLKSILKPGGDGG
jgi:hypothetical protein